jgi:hypothetical protein
MARESFEETWNKVLASAPVAGADLARMWVEDAYRDLAERRDWSWRLKRNKIDIPAAYTTGTFTATNSSYTINGSGTTWTTSMIGRQFKYSDGYIYDITDVTSPTCLTLSQPWAGDGVSGGSYTILQAYFTAPSDFQSFLSITYPEQARQLHLHVTQEEIDYYDPDRTYSADPVCISGVDYSSSYAGEVYPAVQVVGTGPDPTSSGTYTGADDAIFIIEITTGGASGTAEYRWRKNEGSWTSGVVTSTAAATLQEGVKAAFPTETYVLGDIWVIRARPVATPGLPRFELYPHQLNSAVLPYWYIVDIEVSNPASNNGVLPRYIPGYVLREGALARAARWSGSTEKPNPYAQIARAESHEQKFAVYTSLLEVRDNEIIEQNIRRAMLMPYMELPWTHSQSYEQGTDYGW